MRRPATLVLLLALVGLLQPLGSAGYGAQALLTFGFLVLAAYTVGEVVHGLHGPKIVGYLIAGMLFGPSVLGVFGAQTVQRLQPVSDLAVALIAFLAGAELRWQELRARGTALLRILSVELGLTFVVMAGGLFALRELVPFLRDAPTREAVAVCLLFAAVAVAHSPAATMALLTETRARGPVARSTLGIVLLSDVAIVLLFSAILAVGQQLVASQGAPLAVHSGGVFWAIAGALVVGALLGGAITLYLRVIGQELFLVAILVTLLGAELARVLHVETLLTLVTAGFVAENVSREGRGEALRRAMERSAAPVFVVFFALSGAAIDLRALAGAGLVVVPLAVARGAALWGGVRLGARWAGVTGPEQRYLWLGLVSQAGVALGLAALAARAHPQAGQALQTLLLALIAVNQAIGPVLFRGALVRAGEARADDEVVGADLQPASSGRQGPA